MSVTIEEIANELGLSRNTVSKVLNNKPVSSKTKQLVLEMCKKKHYKAFDDKSITFNTEGKKVLLVASNTLMNIPFHIYVMKGIETELNNHDISLVRYTISQASPLKGLKNYIDNLKVDAIICAEFFKSELIKEVLSLDLPTVFLDFPRDLVESKNSYDIVLMENIYSVREYCNSLIKDGICKSFGYIGDIKHCLSFYERYIGMRSAMDDNNLLYNPNSSIITDNAVYSDIDKLTKLIKKCDIPDCFVCANDYLAMMLLEAFNTLNIKVPNDVMIVGFENSAESRISTPTLSTININKITLGTKIVSTLLYRMRHKKVQSQIIYLKGDLVKRETTNFN